MHLIKTARTFQHVRLGRAGGALVADENINGVAAVRHLRLVEAAVQRHVEARGGERDRRGVRAVGRRQVAQRLAALLHRRGGGPASGGRGAAARRGDGVGLAVRFCGSVRPLGAQGERLRRQRGEVERVRLAVGGGGAERARRRGHGGADHRGERSERKKGPDDHRESRQPGALLNAYKTYIYTPPRFSLFPYYFSLFPFYFAE